MILSYNDHSTKLKRCRCKIILILACCLSRTYFSCQTRFTTSQRYHMRSGEERGLLALFPSPFHRTHHREWHFFFSTAYTKVACYYSSTTEHMLHFLCIPNILGSSRAEQHRLQDFLTCQDQKEPHKLSNRCLLLRYVFNHRRTNLIN